MDRPKPFFDLSAAAASSHRLMRRPVSEGVAVAPRPSPAGASSTTESPAANGSSLPPFRGGTFDYKIELWDALLEWGRTSLGFDGCFALDGRGFLVSSRGELGEIPPEVFQAGFASTENSVAPYARDTVLTAAVFGFDGGLRVSLLTIDVAGESVLVGFVGEAVLSAAQLSDVRRTLETNLTDFEASVHTAPGEETQ